MELEVGSLTGAGFGEKSTHHQDGRDQGRLAPDPVTDVAEDDPTDRAGGEPDSECGQSQQCSSRWVHIGKEDLAEYESGDGSVDVEVVPLDRGADHARDDGAPATRFRGRSVCVCSRN